MKGLAILFLFLVVTYTHSLGPKSKPTTSKTSTTASCNDCYFPNGTFATYAKVLSCMKCVPYNETVKRHTLEQLSKATELYVFKDIAVFPPEGFNPVPLQQFFDKWMNTTFEDDFSFQKVVFDLFIKLRDAHTQYYPPKPYRFVWFQPLFLFSYADEPSAKTVNLAVSNATVSLVYKYYKAQGIDLADYFGARVLEINGVDALSSVLEFTQNEVGETKDPQTRFNIALIQSDSVTGGLEDGLFSFRSYFDTVIPNSETMTWKVLFENGTQTTVKFSWIALSQAPSNTAEEYFGSYWRTPSSLKEELVSVEELFPRSAKRNLPTKNRVAASTNAGVAFYHFEDTLVWYQDTFEPEDEGEYWKVVIEGLLYAKLKNLKNLILDMSLNGGGDICLGRAVAQLLYPKFEFPKSLGFFPSDMPSSPLALNLTRSAMNSSKETIWSPAFYQPYNGNAPYSNDDISWIYPGITRVRGGLSRNYSQLVHIADTGCGKPPFYSDEIFAPQNTIFLSRGFCGSTCAMFADMLVHQLNISSVVFGGFDSTLPQSFRSFPGGQVMDDSPLYEALDALGQNTEDQSCTSCSAPRRLLTSATFRICVRELYKDADPDATAIPTEYVWEYADFHFLPTREMVADIKIVWDYVRENFFVNATMN